VWTGVRHEGPQFPEHRHVVERGLVWCPLHDRRDLEISVCQACPWLIAARVEGGDRWVRCAPPAFVSPLRLSPLGA
jgi:hypothetical protein